jgi:nucleotide-binding universal stress UspA family protein
MAPKILIPVDDSETSEKTVQAVIARRDRFPAPLVLLHIADIDRLAYRMIPDFQVSMVREHARRAGEQLLDHYQRLFAEAGMRTETRLEFGSPRTLICRIADGDQFELLILGRRGTGEIRDVLFGSVVNHVLHHVRCPVLLF